jgi:putative endonuclease
MYFVYILKSLNSGKFYTGFTHDLRKRLLEHNGEQSRYTKSDVPWELIYFEGYKSETDARKREMKLKHYGNSRTHLMKRISKSLL